MTKTRVAVLDDYQHRAHELADWSVLDDEVEVTFFHDVLHGEELLTAVRGFEVLVVMRERTAFPRALLEQLPHLRLLVTTGMRNAAVDTDYLHECGITVCGTEGGGNSTTEITWALLFSLVKRVTSEDRALRRGSWQTAIPADLSGATLGLAGLGRLGAAMVEPARVFGMNVIAWSTNLTEERTNALGVTKVTKEELLATSDILSIHLVLSDRSRGLFQAADLKQMKSTAFLINTSRGPIIDEEALIDLLTRKAIAGAGLDVFDREPLPTDHPFLALENTVLTPHLGYVSESSLGVMYRDVVEDIAAFLSGEPVRLVN